MAKYYVRNDGHDTANGANNSSNATTGAWQTLAKLNSTTFSAGDTIVLVRGNTWAEVLTVHNAGTNGSPITYTAEGLGAPPKVLGTGTYACNCNSKNYITFNKIDISGGLTTVTSSTGVTFNFCMLRSSSVGALNVVGSAATCTVTCNNCVIAANATYAVYSQGASAVTTLNNCMIIGNGQNNYGISNQGSATTVYTNCFFSGNSWAVSNNVLASGGTMTDGGGNLYSLDPKITSFRNGNAYFVLTFDDDYVNGNLTAAVVSALAPYNVKATIGISPAKFGVGVAATYIAAAAAGHRLSNHGMTHSIITAASLFTVSSTNASPTVNLDYANQQIVLSTSTPGNTVTVSWATTVKLISDLTTAVVGKGWTIGVTSGVDPTLPLSSAADSGGAQNAPYAVLPDNTAGNGYPFWTNEILACDAWILANTGQTCQSMEYASSQNDLTTRTWIRDYAGLLAGRNAATTALDNRLANINLYQLAAATATAIAGDGSEAATRAQARHAWVFAKTQGLIYIAMTHSDWTAQQVGWFVNEILKAGGRFSTLEDAAVAIRADHATADNFVFTKTYPDLSNYQLRAGSPLIAAGTVAGADTTDIYDNPIKSGATMDIGAAAYVGGIGTVMNQQFLAPITG